MSYLWVVEGRKKDQQEFVPYAVEFSRDQARAQARNTAVDFTRIRRYIRDENSRS